MSNLAAADTISQKTRELCEAIVAQPGFRAHFARIEAFLADDQARSHYERVVNQGETLHEKQHKSLPLDGTEVAAFEKDREALLANTVARGFIEAQDEIHDLQHSIQKQIKKTLQLGRLPSADELGEGCGNGSCGCHGH